MILRNSAWEWPNHDLALSGEVCWTKVVAVNDSRIRANAAVHLVRKCNSENCPLSLLCWGLKMRSTKGKVTSDSHDNDSDGVGMNTSLCTVENWQTSAHLQVLAGATRWIFKRYYLQRVLMQHSTTQHIFDVSHVGEKWIYGRVWNKVRPRTTVLVVLLAVLMLYLLLRKPEKRMEVHTHACACKTHKKGHARTLTQIPIKWTCPHVHFWRCDKLGDMFHIDLHFESESEASSCLIPLIVEIHCQTKHKTTSITLCVLKATT